MYRSPLALAMMSVAAATTLPVAPRDRVDVSHYTPYQKPTKKKRTDKAAKKAKRKQAQRSRARNR
jgi:hypothetical protein